MKLTTDSDSFGAFNGELNSAYSLFKQQIEDAECLFNEAYIAKRRAESIAKAAAANLKGLITDYASQLMPPLHEIQDAMREFTQMGFNSEKAQKLLMQTTKTFLETTYPYADVYRSESIEDCDRTYVRRLHCKWISAGGNRLSGDELECHSPHLAIEFYDKETDKDFSICLPIHENTCVRTADLNDKLIGRMMLIWNNCRWKRVYINGNYVQIAETDSPARDNTSYAHPRVVYAGFDVYQFSASVKKFVTTSELDDAEIENWKLSLWGQDVFDQV